MELSQLRHQPGTSFSFDKDMKRRLLLSLVAIAALTIGGLAYYRSTASAEVPHYMTAAISRGDVVQTVEATGTLQAVTTVQVGSQVSGTISALLADYNSQVKKGQVIARLDPSLLQAQVDQAEATIVRLEADVDRARVALDDAQHQAASRARSCSSSSSSPEMDLESAEATARQAEAAVKSAQAQVTQARGSLNQNQVNLSHTVITAPVDGIVISRNVDVGQTVAASMSAPTLFVIAKDLSEMQVNASIDEADIGQIKAGPARDLPRRRVSARHVHGHRRAGAARADRRAERRELRHRHQRAQQGAQAEARHDRQRDGGDRAGRQRAARAERGAAIPAAGRSDSAAHAAPTVRRATGTRRVHPATPQGGQGRPAGGFGRGGHGNRERPDGERGGASGC